MATLLFPAKTVPAPAVSKFREWDPTARVGAIGPGRDPVIGKGDRSVWRDPVMAGWCVPV